MTVTEKKTPTRGTVARTAREFSSQRGRLVLVALSTAVYIVTFIWTPVQSAVVIDTVWAQVQALRETGAPFSFGDALLGQLVLLTVLYAVNWLTYWYAQVLMSSVAETLVLGLRRQVAAKLNRLPLRFFDANKPGEVLSRVTSDLDKVSETLQTGLFQLLIAVGTVAGSLVVMLVYSWQLTCVFLAFMAAALAVTDVVAGRSLAAAEARQETVATLTGMVEEYYTGRDVIRSFNREGASSAAVREATEANRAANERCDFLMNCMNPLIRLLTRAALCVIAVMAGADVLAGAMTLGVAMAFFQFVNMAAEPLTQLAYMINTLQGAVASMRRTFSLLDEVEEVPDGEPAALPAPGSADDGAVAFEHVAFGYTPEARLMHDVGFSASPGQQVAIVGPTGAGKTTLVNLLMRFYEVDGGSVTVDGVPTREMTRRQLRDRFGMVLQDTWLFEGTVAENIAYARPDATFDEIVEAAKAARVDHFIRTMPQGYDTMLDNEGAALSAGQRQLITIARVFLRDPDVIILDEATSSVDTRTEMAIGEAMDRLMAGRTSFVIAHRLSTIRDADLILYMEHGDIVEQGTHESLLAAGGRYAALYNSQFS